MHKKANDTNKTKQNWFDHNPFFTNKDGYENFVSAMMEAAEEGNLPIALQHQEPEILTLEDIKLFTQRFKRDTGLEIEFKLFTCNHCESLHCLMIVDELSEDMEDEE